MKYVLAKHIVLDFTDFIESFCWIMVSMALCFSLTHTAGWAQRSVSCVLRLCPHWLSSVPRHRKRTHPYLLPHDISLKWVNRFIAGYGVYPINRSLSKEHNLFETEIFCNVYWCLYHLINLMHSCWIKVFISFLFFCLTDPKYLNCRILQTTAKENI